MQPELINGSLYIADSTWSVKHAVLSSDNKRAKTTISITYFEIQKNIFLPVTYHNVINFNVLGTTGNIEYYSALKYNQLSGKKIMGPEPNVSPDSTIRAEAKEVNDNYWNSLRLQPTYKDSIIHMSDSTGLKKNKINLSKYLIARLLFGGYLIGNEADNFSLRYNGVKMILRDYNYVDGFWLGNTFDFKMNFRNGKSLIAHPYLYYATARKQILTGSDVTYNYDLKRKGDLTLNFGSKSEDFNSLSLTRYQNYFNSLILGENDNFFYQRDYISLSNSIHLGPKIKLSASIGIERRSGISNHTDFNVRGRNKKIKPNIFPNDRFDRTYYTIGLSYSPTSNYSITEALDMSNNNVTPVFNIEYQEGFSSLQTNNSKYKKLKGGISHNIRLDYFNHIDYKMETGWFLKRGKNMHFTDYQHFGASDMLLNLNSLFDSFLLLDNYELQTNRYWTNLFLNYSGKYLLLKYIPFMQGLPFTENLHLKTLFTPDRKSYIETGYSVSVTRYFGIGAFVSFHNIQGRRFGIALSLNLRSLDFI